MNVATAQIEPIEDGRALVTFPLDGEWGLSSLPKLMRTWQQLYDFSYSMFDGTERTFTIRPFRGGFSTVHFYGELHRFVHPEARTDLRSIHYASPGAIELTGVALVVTAACWTINRIVKTWDNIHRVYTETQRRKRDLQIREIDARRSKLAYTKEQWDFIKQAGQDLKDALPLGEDWLEEFEKRTRNAPLAQMQILLGLVRRCKTLKSWLDEGNIALPGAKKPRLPSGATGAGKSRKKGKGGKKKRKGGKEGK